MKSNLICFYSQRNDHTDNGYLIQKANSKGPRGMWVPKTTARALLSFMSLGASTSNEKCYLDSGCSRHMIRNMSYFSSLSKIDGGDFTYGDNERVRSARWYYR